MSKVVFDKLLGLQLSHNHVNLNGDTMTGALTNTLATGNSLVWDTNTLVVDATNHRVGIGTTGPGAKLDVLGSIRAGTDIYIGEIDIGTGTQVKLTSGNVFFRIQNWNGSTYDDILYATNGNVGIGTTGPGAKLHVQDSLNGEVVLRIANATSGTAAYVGQQWDASGDGTNRLGLYVFSPGYTTSNMYVADSGLIESSSTLSEGLGLSALGSGANQVIRFWTNSLERMRITNSGNVGIGTTGPGAKLEVNGTSGLLVKDTSGNNPKLVLQETIGVNNNWNEGQIDVTGRAVRILNEGNLVATFGSNGTKRLYLPSYHDYLTTGKLTVKKESGDTVLFLGSKDNDVLTTEGYDFLKMISASNTTTFFKINDIGNMFFKAGNYIAPISNATNAINIANAAGTPFVTFDSTAGNLGIGTTSPTNLLSLGGNSARTVWMERTTTAATSGFSLTIQSGGAVAGGTDKNGGDLILAPGLSTGTGNTKVRLQAATTATSTGTADNSLIDRLVITGSKALTDAATSLFDIALLAGQMTGGVVMATIEASDGTDHQAYTQVITFAAVNKGGVYTTTVTANANNDAKAVSAGTLTTSWALATGTNKVTLQVTPTGSLTETTYRVTYMVINNSPQAITIL